MQNPPNPEMVKKAMGILGINPELQPHIKKLELLDAEIERATETFYKLVEARVNFTYHEEYLFKLRDEFSYAIKQFDKAMNEKRSS